jgi:hypothetical protein
MQLFSKKWHLGIKVKNNNIKAKGYGSDGMLFVFDVFQKPG